jgi:hypothetical protein
MELFNDFSKDRSGCLKKNAAFFCRALIAVFPLQFSMIWRALPIDVFFLR